MFKLKGEVSKSDLMNILKQGTIQNKPHQSIMTPKNPQQSLTARNNPKKFHNCTQRSKNIHIDPSRPKLQLKTIQYDPHPPTTTQNM